MEMKKIIIEVPDYTKETESVLKTAEEKKNITNAINEDNIRLIKENLIKLAHRCQPYGESYYRVRNYTDQKGYILAAEANKDFSNYIRSNSRVFVYEDNRVSFHIEESGSVKSITVKGNKVYDEISPKDIEYFLIYFRYWEDIESNLKSKVASTLQKADTTTDKYLKGALNMNDMLKELSL